MTAATAPLFGAGRFEVRGTLGAGGAGTVYRVYDHTLQREVALKQLRTATGRDLYRFKREFRALADIVHPNLVALHELHAAEGTWFFTMELVEGVSFIDWVRPPRAEAGPQRPRRDIRDSPVHEVRLRGALIQLVDALLALHKATKLHRDLKPSNVLVTPQGRLALLDFGLVATVAEDNPERLAVGTPVYMSPEQAADQTLTEASDWYSVGAMLYEALTGQRPFEGDSEQVMTRKQTESPVDPRQITPNIPPDLARLCLQMLSPAPLARPTGLAILDHLGATPSQKTRDMVRSATPASFVGRGRELDELRRALTDTRTRGVAMLVRGKSGIGKSTLIRKFVRGLGEQVFVLEGRCFEREQVPFKMLDGIVDMLTGVIVALPPLTIEGLAPKDLGALIRLFPVMKRVKKFSDLAAQATVPADPGELRRRGFHALRALLVRLARYRPLVVFVDDAHWGDADSLAFFTELVHQPDPAILVVIAHRPEDYLGVISKLKAPTPRRGDIRELELQALPEEDAIALVSQLADATRTEALVRAGAGNPLVLTEMAVAADLTFGDQAPTIDELVRARVGRVSPEAQAMLAVSSIAARPLSVEIAARAAGVVGGHDEASQLAAERLATLRRVDGHMILQPAHDHVRQAVLASLDLESRAGWHEALARAFEDVQGEVDLDAQAVVEHWLAAGHPVNAAHHAVNAGLRAEEALAFRRAAELYEIALAYGPWDATGQRDLMRKKANALACAGLLDEAAAVYGHAAEVLPDEESIDLQRLHIEALLRRGRLDEAVPAAAQLLAHIGVRSSLAKSSSKTRLAAQWFSSKLRGLDYVERLAQDCRPSDLLRIDVLYSIVSGLAFADPSLGRTLQAELLRAALECGEPVRVCLALAQEVCYASGAGSRNATAVEAVGARLDALAERIGHPHVQGLARAARGIAAVMNGRWRDARGYLESGVSTLREHGAGARWEIDIAESYWLQALFYLGDWRELARQGHGLLREALDRGDIVAQLGFRTGTCNMTWLFAGRADESRAQLAAATACLPSGFALPHVMAMVAACNVALYTQDAAEASRVIAETWPEIERLGVLRFQYLRVELEHLRGRVALADRAVPRDDRARIALEISEALVAEGAPWAAGLGLLLRAAALALLDTPEAALTALHAAEEQFVATHMTGYLQLARMRRGVLEGSQGSHARAAAARDALRDSGVLDPERLVDVLVPWDA
jgi:tRNA A-37 threonylcarbamoyl transferase component Bud32/tetratricopeptide (TPR) repeat protein